MHSGQGSTSVLSLCFFSFLTGVGSSASFGGAIKAGKIVTSTLHIVPN